MVMTRHASCSCGALAVSVEGEPLRISLCHCRACQRRTGSPFGQQARFPRSAACITGASREYRRRGDSGNAITFHFCGECGSTVHYLLDALADVIAIPVGAFADPAFPPPRISVYDEQRHPWVQLPASSTSLE